MELEQQQLQQQEEEEEMLSGEEEEMSSDEGEGEDDDEDVVPKDKREPYNDQDGLQAKLSELQQNLEWVETLQVTIDTTDMKAKHGITDATTNNNEKTAKNEEENTANDDFQREMIFYCQAQEAVKEALSKLESLGVPTQRPDDYFAEMVKSDVHMQKVRKKLLEKKDGIEKSEQAKRQRELKKIGKKVQQNVLQKRQQEKKKMLQEVDRMKKGKSDKLYGDGGDTFDVSTGGKRDKGSGAGSKRKHKDEKFGFGGRKWKLKKNSAESAAEMDSFKSHVHGKTKSRSRNNPAGGRRGKAKGKLVNHNKKKR